MLTSWYKTDFLQETSLHGCKNIGDKSRPTWLRVLWSLVVLSAISYWIFMSVQLYLKTKEYKMRTVFKTQYTDNINFPSVTLCSVCPFDTTQFPIGMEEVLWSTSDWKVLTKGVNLSVSLKTLDSIMRDSKKGPTNIIKQVRWNGEKIDINGSFKEDSSTNDRDCYVFNGADAYKKGTNVSSKRAGMESGLEVIADVNQRKCSTSVYYDAAVKLYFHSPYESTTSKAPHVIVSPGNSANIILKKKQTIFLPYPYKATDGHYCIQSANYSRSVCIQACVNKHLRLTCPCLPKLYDEEDVDLDVIDRNCTGITQIYIDCWLKNRRKLNNEAERGVICDCPYPCVLTEYETPLSFSYFPTDAVSKRLVELAEIPSEEYARRNLLRFRLYFKDMSIEKTKFKPEFQSSYLHGTIGGQLGLFLGASIVTSIEILEIIFLFLWSIIKKVFCVIPTLQKFA